MGYYSYYMVDRWFTDELNLCQTTLVGYGRDHRLRPAVRSAAQQFAPSGQTRE